MLEKKKSFKTHFAVFTTITIKHLYDLFINKYITEPINFTSIANDFDEINHLLAANNSFILISDTSTFSIPYVSQTSVQVSGYSPKEWNDKGISFFADNYCQADVKNAEYFFKQIMEHHNSLPIITRKDYTYISTYRFFHKNGYFVWFQNRAVFRFNDSKGKVLSMIMLITSIDTIKTDDSTSLQIIHVHPQTGVNTVEKTETVQSSTLANFNNSERQILTLLSYGKDNGEIAKELNLSEHTVKDYRKKMLKKTWCSNTVELLYFALRNGLIE